MSASKAKKNEQSSAKPANAPQGEEKQALFFSNPYPLDAKRHAKAGLAKDGNFNFAKDTSSIIITMHEFPEVVRSFPIVFSVGDAVPRPLAIVGLNQKNLFVDENGHWDKAHYAPAYVRKYPFGLAPIPGSEEQALCVDEDAPHFTSKNADFPFFEGDEPTELCKNALQFSAAFQKQLEETDAFGLALKEADLLEEKQLNIDIPNQPKRTLNGFQIIDKDKWHEFAKKNANKWEEKGYVALVSLAIASHANWKYLTLR